MQADSPLKAHTLYLTKVVGTLLCLIAVLTMAATPRWSVHLGVAPALSLKVLTLLLCALAPMAWMVYRGMDELNRALHAQASAVMYPVSALTCCIVGLLQANDVLPLFNLLWVLGAQVAGWGLALMLADRRYR